MMKTADESRAMLKLAGRDPANAKKPITGAQGCQPEAAPVRQHTPAPWRVVAGDDYYIAADGYPTEFIGHFKCDDLGDYLALVGNRPADFGEANAAFIVEAVNSHATLQARVDELTKALTVAAERLEARGHNFGASEARRTLSTSLEQEKSHG